MRNHLLVVANTSKHWSPRMHTHENTHIQPALFINKHIKTPPLVRAASVAGANSTRPKMSEEYIAGRVWGDKRTRLKMSVSPVAMTARKVWQGPECFSQRRDSLLRLIEPVVSGKTVWGICYKKMLGNNYTLLIMIKKRKKHSYICGLCQWQ